MSTKQKALRIANQLGAEIEANKSGGNTDVCIWSKDGETWVESGGSCLCESTMAGFSVAEMWSDLIDRMELGYD